MSHQQCDEFQQHLRECADQIDDLRDLLADYPDVDVSMSYHSEFGRQVLTLRTPNANDLPNSVFMALCIDLAEAGHDVEVKVAEPWVVGLVDHGEWQLAVSAFTPKPDTVQRFKVQPVGAL
jgi:hypothetical protein